MAATLRTQQASAEGPVASSTSQLWPKRLEEGLPPLQPGELRLCGVTFHPSLAAAMRGGMARWEAATLERVAAQGLCGGLAYASPQSIQVYVRDAQAPSGHSLSGSLICARLARLVGLVGPGGGRSDAPLPEGALWLAAEAGLWRCADPARGGYGLAAGAVVRKNAVVGVVRGYVMPGAPAEGFVAAGYRHCRPEVRAELARAVGGTSADVSTSWRLLVGSYCMPYAAALQAQGEAGAGTSTSAAGGKASEGAVHASAGPAAPQPPSPRSAALGAPARAPERRWLHDQSGEQVQQERLQRLLDLSQYTRPQQALANRPNAPEASSSPRGSRQQRTSAVGSEPREPPARLSAPELRPLVVAARAPPDPRGPATVTANHQPSTASRTAVYGELASAAASLASAAHKLARGSAADRTVAASYETLAQAAANLAASAFQIRPGGVPASGGKQTPGPQVQPAPAAARARAAAADERASQSLLPRAVDPMAPTAHEAGGGGAGLAAAFAPGRGGGGGSQGAAHGAVAAPSAAGSGGRARVAAPRFPGYNPLIHLLSSQLPLPGTPGVGRPVTASPITHRLEADKPLPSSAGRSTAAASSQYGKPGSSQQYGNSASQHHLHMQYGGYRTGGSAAGFPPAPLLLHPADLSRLPVLSLSADGAAQGFSAGAAGGEVWSSQQLRVGGGGGGGDGGGRHGGALPPLGGGAGAAADAARMVGGSGPPASPAR
ncbi:hypothetical protein TSOC_004793 [Tetrabaena socialis]|uniref:Uncharacterized protein n=1 Tax=Tetrabaena socialis TaxID=47790 RepID=A0A2J8A7X4_9CHLO|nr:hypothetical protein TSOC_004793 [Tetrabaena socialis]|eukprot:PNH08639.1 hypothetical protein TSOC_004793 [Tetrabaena socialis]